MIAIFIAGVVEVYQQEPHTNLVDEASNPAKKASSLPEQPATSSQDETPDPVVVASMKAWKASKLAEVKKQYWQEKLKYIGITLLSLIGFWVFCWIVGWIIRGFVGIPMGKDFKE